MGSQNRSAEEAACRTTLTWGRQTSVLGNVSLVQCRSGSFGVGKAQPIQEGICCNPTRGQQAITLNLFEMRSQLLPFLAALTVKAVSTAETDWFPLIFSHWS